MKPTKYPKNLKKYFDTQKLRIPFGSGSSV